MPQGPPPRSKSYSLGGGDEKREAEVPRCPDRSLEEGKVSGKSSGGEEGTTAEDRTPGGGSELSKGEGVWQEDVDEVRLDPTASDLL